MRQGARDESRPKHRTEKKVGKGVDVFNPINDNGYRKTENTQRGE